MDKYDEIAEREGVYLAPFTSGYLDLYGSKGVKVLERFLKTNPNIKLVSTTELIRFVKSEGKEKVLMED